MNFIEYLTSILALSLLIDNVLSGEYRQFNFTSNCRGGSELIQQRILFLEQGKAALVNESWNTKFLPLNDIQCMVMINTTTRYSGLFAVIQKLNFRTKSNEKNDCRDYVQIKYGGGDKTGKICTEIGTEETPAMSFNSPTGDMSIQLHIGGRKPEDVVEEFIEISMVLTNYRDCDDSFAFSCTRNNKGCIPMEYYRDSVVNCDSPLCADEVSCLVGQQSVVRKTLNSSNIAISAITSFIFTALGVGGCLWCCWKYRYCLEECFAGPPPSVPTAEQQTVAPPPIELQLPQSPSVAQPSQSRQEDKDLPPSYDTLFPDK